MLPLITLPYLVRVLGVEYYGLLSFAMAVIMYFQIITDYGFNITATREISIYRNNKIIIREIFSSVLIIKMLLMIVSLIILTFLIFSFQRFSNNRTIYFLTFTIVPGYALFPVWFFQGMERMKYITYLNILAKSIFTIAVFIFVRKQEHYFLVPLFTSTGFLVVGIWSLILISRDFGINFKIQPLNKIIYYLKEGWHIFLSNIAVSLYTMTTILLLGIFTNNTIVGYYSVVDKLINAFKGLFSPVSQTLYPYISNQASISKEKALAFLNKLLILTAIPFFILSLILFIFAKEIISIVFGFASIHSVTITKILAVIPFLVALDTVTGTLTMLVFNRKRSYSRIIISAGILNIILTFILIPLYQHIGAAVSVLITEIYITLNLFYYTSNNDLLIFRGIKR